MKTGNDEECFQQAPQGQQCVEEVMITKTQLMGDANPIYVKKNEVSGIDYETATLKVIPILNNNQISSYIPFKLSKKTKQLLNNTKKFAQDEELQQITNMNKLRNTINHLTAFNAYYQRNQIVYSKYNNSMYNLYKDSIYFAATFVPRDVLSSKFKIITYNIKQDIFSNNIGTILRAKQKNDSYQLSKPINYKNQNPMKTHRFKGNLQFDSNFQSGNLFVVFKTGKYSYDLVLQNDINSRGSTQWFYFSIQGIEINIDYTFKIVNFTKNDSLFNYGMKPVIYSLAQNRGVPPTQVTQQKQQKIGWYRYGKQVTYEKGNIQRQSNNKKYYTLKFIINWSIDGDKIYVAHSYPYTYTRMMKLMRRINQKYSKIETQKGSLKKKNQKASILIETIKIGKSIALRQISAYLISAKKTNKIQPKQAIIFMARQHPGQTQGSFVCQGVIKRLTQSNTSKQVIFLLQNYLVYVIPMVNPDGVIFGNYRTNLCGKDLNRRWDSQINTIHGLLTPQVLAIKQFIGSLVKNNGVSIRFILDLHGHSKKLNSFFYGNPCLQNPQKTKIYPYICSRYSQAIQFMDCTFVSQQYKKKAARIYLSSLYQQLHIYTFEASFYGYTTRQGKIIQFTSNEYLKLGTVLVNSLCLLLLTQKKQQTQLLNSSFDMKQLNLYKKSMETYTKFETELKQNQLLLRVGDELSSGSESKPDEGQLNNQQILYQSQQDQVDPRVVVTHKIVSKSQSEKQKTNNNNTGNNISKNKSIRINSRKISQQSTIQYKQTTNKHLNKKLITISQVNGVLADKYQISLLPIERVAYRTGKKMDVQTQTQRQQKLAIRLYKLFEIEEKSNLAGGFCQQSKMYNQVGSTGISQKIQSQSLQPKKHSQIVAEIQKNSRHHLYRMNLMGDKQLINKRKITQPSMLKQSMSCKQKLSKKKEVFTQTIATFKNLKNSPKISGTFQIKNQNLQIQQLKLTQNELRIARMEKINQEVLKIYSKKSTVIDLSFKPRANRSNQKLQKRNQIYNYQTFQN